MKCSSSEVVQERHTQTLVIIACEMGKMENIANI